MKQYYEINIEISECIISSKSKPRFLRVFKIETYCIFFTKLTVSTLFYALFSIFNSIDFFT
jgi:hypothetical protein